MPLIENDSKFHCGVTTILMIMEGIIMKTNEASQEKLEFIIKSMHMVQNSTLTSIKNLLQTAEISQEIMLKIEEVLAKHFEAENILLPLLTTSQSNNSAELAVKSLTKKTPRSKLSNSLKSAAPSSNTDRSMKVTITPISSAFDPFSRKR